MRDLLKLLANGNYIILNRDLIKELGLDETVLLGELCSEQQYWERKMKLGKDGFFYSTIENIEKQICFKKKKQLTLLNKLKSLNLVDVKYHDMPKKRYIKVNVSRLETIQEQFLNRKNNDEVTLTEADYDIINKVVFEKDINKELRNLFAEHILKLKQEKQWEVNLKNVRGLANALKELEKYPIEEQKKIIRKSTAKTWRGYIYGKKPKEENKKEKKKHNTNPDEIIEVSLDDDGVDSGIIDLTGVILKDDEDDCVDEEIMDFTNVEVEDYE